VSAYIPITVSGDTHQKQQHENFSYASTQTDTDIIVNTDGTIEVNGQQQTDNVFFPAQQDSDIDRPGDQFLSSLFAHPQLSIWKHRLEGCHKKSCVIKASHQSIFPNR